MLMSHLIYATFSLLFHFKLDEGFDIQSHQIWILHQQTPMTKSKNSARPCNLCRHQANLQKQKGQNCKVHLFGNNDFSFVFEIVVGKSQVSLHFAFCTLFLDEMFSLPYAYRDLIIWRRLWRVMMPVSIDVEVLRMILVRRLLNRTELYTVTYGFSFHSSAC